MTQKNSKAGFTMVEIIAVLVIIGIMAAVAAPKFLNMSAKARLKAAVAGISEAKASLSVAYAKEYLDQNGDASAVDATGVMGEVDGGVADGGTVTFGDVVVQFDIDGADVDLTATSYDGTDISSDGVTDTWSMPVQ